MQANLFHPPFQNLTPKFNDMSFLRLTWCLCGVQTKLVNDSLTCPSREFPGRRFDEFDCGPFAQFSTTHSQVWFFRLRFAIFPLQQINYWSECGFLGSEWNGSPVEYFVTVFYLSLFLFFVGDCGLVFNKNRMSGKGVGIKKRTIGMFSSVWKKKCPKPFVI